MATLIVGTMMAKRACERVGVHPGTNATGHGRHGGRRQMLSTPGAPAFESPCIMPPPPPIPLADLAPGGLVAPTGHEAACNALAEALLSSGHAVIDLHKRPAELEAAARAVAEFWQRDGQDKAALRPPQLRDGVGYRALTDERELLEHRVGPWLRDDAPLPALAAVSRRAGLGLGGSVAASGDACVQLVCLVCMHKSQQPALSDLSPPALSWPHLPPHCRTSHRMQASSALDPIARSLLAALCRSAFVHLPGSALAPVLDDLPLPPRAWASSSLQCFHYRAGSGGCEGQEDRPLLILIYAPGQPGLQVGVQVGYVCWQHLCSDSSK